MSLVAYATSEDSEDDTNQDEANLRLPNETESMKQSHKKLEDLDKLNSAKKKPVQIVLPSLDQDDSDSDDDSNRPISKSLPDSTKPGERCGLFAVLPPPSTATQLVPHVLSKKPAVSRNSLVLPPAKGMVSHSLSSSSSSSSSSSVTKFVSTAAPTALSCIDDKADADHDETPTSFFFSESTSNNLPISKKAIHIADDVHRSVESAASYSVVSNEADSSPHSVSQLNANISENPVDEHQILHGTMQTAVYDSFEPESSSTLDSYLKDEQFLRLCGRKRHLKEPVDIVDICADDQLQDVDLTKAISEEVDTVMSHSKKRNKDMPSSQQKRKHQITFLAFKAKERELELKNQWSENKFNKRQTQSKYGF